MSEIPATRIDEDNSVQGWKQFLTNRKEILNAYDVAREQSGIHEVEVFHGKVAEAEFRKWLNSFLPRRYGVTSGYIISQGVRGRAKAPHFDVIIYDQLEAPVLWIESNPDSSEAGKSAAIPCEFVLGVIEVKSQLTPSTMDDAITHLRDLSPLMANNDSLGERYPRYLPPTFFCLVVFFELRTQFVQSGSVLTKIMGATDLRGFFGAFVLRGDGIALPATGQIRFFAGTEKMPEYGESLLKGMQCETVESEGRHVFATIIWSVSAFAGLAFDLLALMKGRYRSNFGSSFHGQAVLTDREPG